MTGVHVSLANPAVVKVEEVDRGGAADQAGFRPGDVIVEIAGVLVEGRVPHGMNRNVESQCFASQLSVCADCRFEI